MDDDDRYGIGRYIDDHSLGWRDTSPESGGQLGRAIRVLVAVLFMIVPIAAIIGGILYAILKAVFT